MSEDINYRVSHKSCDTTHTAAATRNEDFLGLGVAEAAAGDKNNDDVTRCRVCTSRGFPSEPILFEKIPGRVLSDGTNEVKRYHVINYTDNSPHKHKDFWKDLAPRLWQQAMEGS
jgi:hypothetical protein